jgi:hypothetical protein
MATKFVTNLDLNRNQILNATFEVLATDPSTDLFDGRMYFNSADGVIKIYDSTASAWRKVIAGIGEQAGVIAGGSHATALTISESNGQITITPNLATSASAGLLSASDFTKLGDATSEATANKLVIRDGSGQAKFGTPTDDAHAATKGYVDAARAGLDVKQSVRAATTGAINLAGDLENGDVIDGVTLAAGDRVLVKHQGTASENGIYVVQASDAAVRATDFDGTGEVSGGAFTFVEEGTTHADSGWVVSSNGAITVGTDAINWVQFSGAGQIAAGDGLTKTGNTINVVGTADRITANADSVDIASTYAGQSSITTLGTITTGTWDATTVAVTAGGTGVESFTDNGIVYGNGTSALDVTAAGTQHQVLLAGASGVPGFGAVDLSQSAAVTNDLPVTHGGTGASTESDARTNLAAGGTQGSGVSTPALARKVSKVVGNGVDTSFTLVHAFNTREVLIQVYDSSSYDTVIADTIRTDTDTVTVQFSAAPSSNAFTIVVIG